VTAPPPDTPDPVQRPGASTFTIEGRAAPGLFVLGWLATLLGLGVILVAAMSGPSGPSPILLLTGMLVLSVGLVAGAGAQAIERRARGGRAYTGPSPFLVFAAGIPISGILGIMVGAVFEAVGIPVDGSLGRLAAILLQAAVYIGLIRLLVVDSGALSWAQLGVTRPTMTSLGEMGLGAIFAFAVILATIPVALLVSRFLPVPPESPLPPAGDLEGLVINLVAGVIVAPISEEIMFRGFATTAWMADMGKWRGVIRGALFFAVVHVLTITGVDARQAFAVALAAFLGRIPVALALGWLFTRTRTIWAPLGLHAAFNGILLLIAEAVFRSGLTPV
jgi:membrane protease YdiL (CAAX protease family)